MRTIDGDLIDWTSADRLNAPGTTANGYELYGNLSAGTLAFALKAPTAIGASTTIWLDTDRSDITGHKVLGTYGGYDYNITFAADGKPYLYTGSDGQTLTSVTPLTYTFNADKTAVEFSLPLAQTGAAASAVNILADVNNTTFLPGDYAAGPYSVIDTSTLPVATDTSHKVGIVYSATTAAQYFSPTAYSQLFMSVQNQAAAAGIPYDLLTEADLTNLAKLANYDTLIFPSFRNVPAANLTAIQDTLTTLVKNYHVGLITAGDFMTNDATGAALPGDSYARSKSLLDISRLDGASGVTVDVVAGSTTNPVMAGYTAGELIRQYTNTGTSYFTSTDGLGTTLASQVVNGQTFNAVLATQTGGRNVHFATEGMLADNNMLAHALDWTAQPTSGPQLSLHMSRNKAVVASRVDMDQAMETADVSPATGQGIYDKLLPILTQWKQAYNFVGSYYIDIGNNAAVGQTTDWAISKPYYTQMLAMGNEIGSHSYTHPENTNLLTPAQFQFEFQQARQVIEQQLGLTGIGVAVPGAPETIETARQIAQYYPYISGGASLVGAGYPGAIGYLTPGDMNSVYIAPNTSFDFTLVGFQKLTAAQAEAAWAKEWASLTAHSDLPVIVWPWHDYGPTNWVTDENTPPSYTTQMFTSFISRAAQAGSEFVTLADLAQRVSSFEKSTLTYSYEAATNAVTATVGTTGAGLGTFALDLGAGTAIRNVANWYAYDSDSVFVARTGGTFTIALGSTPDDVTHLTVLPDRSELLRVSGNGSDLNFSLIGDGHAVVDLKQPTGKVVLVSGADSYSVVGDKLDLAFTGLGQHDVLVNLFAAGVTLTGTAGNDTLTGTANSDTLTGGAGNDTLNGLAGPDVMTGGAGNDIYYVDYASDADHIGDRVIELAGGGIDTVRTTLASYTLGAEIENLSFVGAANTAFTGTGNALANTITGGTGNDKLNGGAGADLLIGGLGNDLYIVDSTGDQIIETAGGGTDTVQSSVTLTLAANVENLVLTGSDAISGTGNALNNVLTGNSGANTLDGGAGYDVATWSDVRRAYTIKLGTGPDTVASKSGTDTLINVEHLTFVDGEYETDVGSAAATVYRLYDATLDRAPDAGGLKAWLGGLQGGMTKSQVAAGFVSSPEFQQKYGNLSDVGFITALYNNVLDRAPEQSGLAAWLGGLAGGVSRSNVVLGFSESSENIERLRPNVEQGLWLRDDGAASVARLYSSVLGRLPDSPGLAAWKGGLAGGITLKEIAAGFMTSMEFQQKYGSLDDTGFVTQLYHNVLQREPESSGLKAWLGGLASGLSRADVVLGFSESPEYVIKQAPFVDDGIWVV